MGERLGHEVQANQIPTNPGPLSQVPELKLHGIPLPWVNSIKILGYTLKIRRGRVIPKTKAIVRGALHQYKLALSPTSPIPLHTQLTMLKANVDCKALYTAPLEVMDYHKIDQAESIALCYITGYPSEMLAQSSYERSLAICSPSSRQTDGPSAISSTCTIEHGSRPS